jgi:hypothetical protein
MLSAGPGKIGWLKMNDGFSSHPLTLSFHAEKLREIFSEVFFKVISFSPQIFLYFWRVGNLFTLKKLWETFSEVF